MKKTILTLTIFIVTLFIIFYVVFYFKSTPQSFIEYLKEHPNNYSLVAQIDTTIIFNHRSEKPMTLASTMKTIIAIEFAYQVAENKIKANEMVSINELRKYYIPYTDGGGHEKWLDDIFEKHGENTKEVSIVDVAKGMIEYSSNANSEYLLDRLTLDKVNSRIDSLKLAYHEDLQYFVSTLFIDSKVFSGDLDNFNVTTDSTHQLLKNNKINIEDFETTEIIEQNWGDKIPKSTTKDYISIMNKINSDNYFPKEVHVLIKQLMEWPMKNQKTKELFYFIGGKGGNTSSVMTYACYSKNKEGNTGAMCIFLKDVSFWDGLFLRKAMNKFIMGFLKSKETRNELITLYNK